ncbi:MAG: hypothetical protein RIS29_43 [Bacteroidota bacterium]|jgi:hypothetical protein
MLTIVSVLHTIPLSLRRKARGEVTFAFPLSILSHFFNRKFRATIQTTSFLGTIPLSLRRGARGEVSSHPLISFSLLFILMSLF